MYITFLTGCSVFVSLPMTPFPPQAEEGSEIWRNYVEYLDDIVLDGFNCIHCSLQYLLDNTNKGRTDMLMGAKFELLVCCP